MKKYFSQGKWRWLMVVMLWVMASQTVRSAAPSVLLLNSYHKGQDWTDTLTSAVETLFESKNIPLSTEYLDSKRFSLEQVSGTMTIYLEQKYAASPPSVIIAADNNALAFLQERKDTLFADVPIVFCGINNYSPELIEGLEGRVTGVVEEIDPAGTIALIQTLQPEAKRIALVSGKSTTGQAVKASSREALDSMSGMIELEWWDSLSMEELLHKARTADVDALLLLTFNKDKNGAYFTNKESGKLISAASTVPVYGLWDFYNGTGIVGGRMASAKDQGEVAAKLCLTYFDTGALDLVIDSSPNTTFLNYPDLARHNLHRSTLPLEATVLNRPPKRNGEIAIFALFAVLICLAGACIAYALFTLLNRNKKVQTGLMQIIRNNTLSILGIMVFSILLLLVGLEYFEYTNSVKNIRASMVQQQKEHLKSEVMECVNFINYLRKSPLLNHRNDMAELQRAAQEQITNHFYDKDQADYLFVLDDTGTMLVHPAEPELQGIDTSLITDRNGLNMSKELIAAAHRPEGGFVSYLWNKPGASALVPKLTYALQVEDWHWIVASGVYLDDINTAVALQAGSLKESLGKKAVAILAIGTASLLLLIVIFKRIGRQVASELRTLQASASNMDPAELKRHFTVSEFQEIADGAASAFKEMGFAQQKFIKAFEKNVAMMSISTLKDGRLIEVNESFLKHLQFTEDEVLGKTSAELGLVNEQLRNSIVENIPKSGDTGIIETQFTDRSGHVRYGEFRAQLIDLDGEPCLLSVIHDITIRKQAEGQIVLLSQAIEQSPVSVVITDLEGLIQYVNPKFCEVTGYSKEEALGNNPRVLKSGEMSGDQYEQLWEAISKGEDWRGEFHNKRKDGTFFWEAATISGIRDAQGKVSNYLAVKEDITEMKSLEGQLVQAQKLESVGQLAAGIAHEINTPIQFVGDNLHFLQDSVSDLLTLAEQYTAFIEQARTAGVEDALIQQQEKAVEDADTEYLKDELPKAIEQSLEGTDRVSKIVRAMKEFSHPGSTEMSSANLNDAIETTITVANNEWKYAAVIERNFAQDLPFVPCLVSEFNQVVLNMIVNARDAIEETGKMGTITFSTSHDAQWVNIQINDSGAGMPKAVQARIFDPFYTTKEVGKGSGQGLAIAHNVIVNKHGGELNVKSEPGKGTTFEIKLPLKQEIEAIEKAS